MNWSITYYNERVRREVMSMPTGIVADYVRLTDAMAFMAQTFACPTPRPWAVDSSSCAPRGLKA